MFCPWLQLAALIAPAAAAAIATAKIPRNATV